ncbi:MAG: DUF975 family protein [Bacteroidales bacterium]|nr:DUF975 family protein [Bacteroidales bacterium]
MKLRSDYKNAALDALKGKWAPSVIAAIILILLYGALAGPSAAWEIFGGCASALIAVFLTEPITLGAANAYKRLYLYSDANVTQNVFTQGFTNYLHIVGGCLLRGIYIFLWTCLLVVPGIIKYYSYAMTYYILVDNPELGCDQAIHRSRELMQGHKMDLFLLDLSFIGWFLLSLITFGIGFFWLIPYFYTTRAAFYEDVKAEWDARNLTGGQAGAYTSSSTEDAPVLTGTISKPEN